MGPPLEYESISFLASSSKFIAAESPLFSGLLISELQEITIHEIQNHGESHLGYKRHAAKSMQC